MEKAAVAGVVAARARVGEVGGGNGGENGGVTAVWMPLSVGDQSEVGQRAFFFFFQDDADDVCRSTKAPKPNQGSRTSKRRRKDGTTRSIRVFFTSRVRVLLLCLLLRLQRRRVRLSTRIL